MDAIIIARFALEYLKTHPTITPEALQEFIFSRPEVGKVLTLRDIRQALDSASEQCILFCLHAGKPDERALYSNYANKELLLME